MAAIEFPHKATVLRGESSLVKFSPKTRLPKDDPVSRQPGSDQMPPRADRELGHLDVDQRLAHLRKQFAPGDAEKLKADAQPWNKSLLQNLVVRRSVKYAAALAV